MGGKNQDGGWREGDSETFIDWGEYFVPDRADQIRIVCDLTPAAGPGDGYVDLCCGEGRLSEALLQAYPNATVLALDGSETMRRAAMARLASFGDRARVEAFDILGDAWRTLPQAPLAIVSSLAIHHLDGTQKQELYRDMHRALRPGGRLIVADLIEPCSRAARSVAAWTWDRAVRRAAMNHPGGEDPHRTFVARNWNYFANLKPDPVDRPSPLLAQLKWLEQAGFVAVDVHWMLAGHAIFSGRKAS